MCTDAIKNFSGREATKANNHKGKLVHYDFSLIRIISENSSVYSPRDCFLFHFSILNLMHCFASNLSHDVQSRKICYDFIRFQSTNGNNFSSRISVEKKFHSNNHIKQFLAICWVLGQQPMSNAFSEYAIHLPEKSMVSFYSPCYDVDTDSDMCVSSRVQFIHMRKQSKLVYFSVLILFILSSCFVQFVNLLLFQFEHAAVCCDQAV